MNKWNGTQYNYQIITQSKLTAGGEMSISSLWKFNLEDLNVSFICCHLVKRKLSTLWIKFVWLNSSQVGINTVTLNQMKQLCNHKFFICYLSSENKWWFFTFLELLFICTLKGISKVKIPSILDIGASTQSYLFHQCFGFYHLHMNKHCQYP